MSFLGRMFGRQQSDSSAPMPMPRGRDPVSKTHIPVEFQGFINELTLIGLNEGFLSFRAGGRFNAQCRHIRAREIGMRLNMMGGSSLMRKIYGRIDCPNVRQLAAAWDEIGDWAA